MHKILAFVVNPMTMVWINNNNLDVDVTFGNSLELAEDMFLEGEFCAVITDSLTCVQTFRRFYTKRKVPIVFAGTSTREHVPAKHAGAAAFCTACSHEGLFTALRAAGVPVH